MFDKQNSKKPAKRAVRFSIENVLTSCTFSGIIYEEKVKTPGFCKLSGFPISKNFQDIHLGFIDRRRLVTLKL